MMTRTTTYYNLEIYGWVCSDSGGTTNYMGQIGYWASMGQSPCGPTAQDVDRVVKRTITEFNGRGSDMSQIRLVVKKVVTVETEECSLHGPLDFTAYVLKSS